MLSTFFSNSVFDFEFPLPLENFSNLVQIECEHRNGAEPLGQMANSPPTSLRCFVSSCASDSGEFWKNLCFGLSNFIAFVIVQWFISFQLEFHLVGEFLLRTSVHGRSLTSFSSVAPPRETHYTEINKEREDPAFVVFELRRATTAALTNKQQG